MNTLEQTLTRYYAAPTPFIYTTTVRHGGIVIAFAMDSERHIRYSVLNLERSGVDSPLDVNYWDLEPIRVPFSNEIGQIGARAAGVTVMPTILKNGAEADNALYVEPEDVDPFLSTTARLTAAAPFKVLSDGEWIYVFRQSLAAGEEDNIGLVDDDGNALLDENGNAVYLVDSTLLVDRFVYVAGELKQKLEVRYQRSRRVDTPASRKDTLGNMDMNNMPFYEPTLELAMIRHMRNGAFAIELLPSAFPGIQRWQIFSFNSATSRIDSFNIERSRDGLFNTRGTRYFTSPDPAHRNDVFERQPGICPFTGLLLVPVTEQLGFAEYALGFNGRVEDAALVAAMTSFPTEDLCIECWIRSVDAHGTILGYDNGAVKLSNPGDLEVTIGNATTGPTGVSVNSGTWRHLAMCWASEDGRVSIYVDGDDATPEDPNDEDGILKLIPSTPVAAGGALTIGALTESGAASEPLTAAIDELRIWSRIKGQGQVNDDMHFRLIGYEPGLKGYWRLDEGAGNTAYDQTDFASHALIADATPADPTLVAIPIDSSHSEALHFDGVVDEPKHIYNNVVHTDLGEFTIEFWIHADSAEDSITVLSYSDNDSNDALVVLFYKDSDDPDEEKNQLKVVVNGEWSGPANVSTNLRNGSWQHAAVTRHADGTIVLCINGVETATSFSTPGLGSVLNAGGRLVLGQQQAGEGEYFTERAMYGALDHVRIWDHARAPEAIEGSYLLSLPYTEPGLLFSSHQAAPISSGWVASDAPIGDHPGVRRSSFTIDGKGEALGMASAFYYQQEPAGAGYNEDEEQPMKRGARLMLVIAATEESSEDRNYLSALDFGISRAGKLALIPDLVSLDVVDREAGSGGNDSVDALLSQIEDLNAQILAGINNIEDASENIENIPASPFAYANVAEYHEDDDQLHLAQTEAQTRVRQLETITGAAGFDVAFWTDGYGQNPTAGYVFLRGDQCLRTDEARNPLADYPRPIVDEWPHLPEGWHSDFDAAVAPTADTIAFVKGTERMVYNPNADADQAIVVDQDIIPVDVEPAGWEQTIHALTIYQNGLFIAFQGNQYWLYDANDPDPSQVFEWESVISSWNGQYVQAISRKPLTDPQAGEGGEEFFIFSGREYAEVSIDSSGTMTLISAPVPVDEASWSKAETLLSVVTERRIDAVLDVEIAGEPGYYFFSGEHCLLTGQDKIALDGYPRTIAEEWSGLPEDWQNDLDAATLVSPGVIQFFKAGDALLYNLDDDTADADNPIIVGSTDGWGDYFDAVASIPFSEGDTDEGGDPGGDDRAGDGSSDTSDSGTDPDEAGWAYSKIIAFYGEKMLVVSPDPTVDDIESTWTHSIVDWEDRVIDGAAWDDTAGRLYLFSENEFVEAELDDAGALSLLEKPGQIDTEYWMGVTAVFNDQTDDELSPEEQELLEYYIIDTFLREIEEHHDEIEELETLIFSEVHLPMPLIHMDPDGHCITGAQLGFAWTEEAPTLVEAINGRLSLQFRGNKNQWFAAYYRLLGSRAAYTSDTDGTGAINWHSRLIGLPGDVLKIEVLDSIVDGECEIHISLKYEALDEREIWYAVPRNPVALAQVINGLHESYNYAALATGGRPTDNLDDGSRLCTISLESGTGHIVNGLAISTSSQASTGPEWFADSPGQALRFFESGSHARPDSTLRLEAADWVAEGDVTVETWCFPLNTSDDFARIVHQYSKEPGASGTTSNGMTDGDTYTLGVLKTSENKSALPFDGTTDTAAVVENFSGFSGDQVTVEFWARTEGNPFNFKGTVFSYCTGPAGQDEFALINHSNLALSIGGKVFDLDVNLLRVSAKDLSFVEDAYRAWGWSSILDIVGTYWGTSGWNHYALTYTKPYVDESGEEVPGVIEFYKNANRVLTKEVSGVPDIAEGGTLVIGQRQTKKGGGFTSYRAFHGAIDEFRVWDVVRTKKEVNDRRYVSMPGKVDHLVGRWNLGELADFSPNELVTSPVEHFSPFARFGNRAVYANQTVPSQQWSHLAAVYHQAYGLEFDGVDDRVECGADASLNITGDLTIEAFFTLYDLDAPQVILSKGRLDSGADNPVPFAVWVNTDGLLEFGFDDEKGQVHSFKTFENDIYNVNRSLRWIPVIQTYATYEDQWNPLEVDTPYRIAIRRTKHTKTEELYDGDVFTGVKVSEWWEIHFFIYQDDAVVQWGHAGYLRYEGEIGGNNLPLEIGRGYIPGYGDAQFHGVIAEVRLWNQGRDHKAFYKEIDGDEEGLVAWWQFQENDGNIAHDSKGASDGRLKGALWVKDPDPLSAKISLFHNGEPLGINDLDLHEVAPDDTAEQFTLGQHAGEIPKDQYQGWIDELRIWKVARTQEQLQDNLFRRLTGEKEQLIAYYDADLGASDTDSSFAIMKDQSGRGLSLELVRTDAILTTAPISEETAAVRNAMADIENEFHQSTEVGPSSEEYGDVQYNTDGSLIGVMKRCYSYIQDGIWRLIAGYKVGDLDLEWIGQAQFDPELVGFIEGAPPVPSENLTVVTDYENASSVAFVHAESSMQSYSVTSSRGVDTSMSLKAGLGFKSKTDAGFGVTTSVEDTNVVVGVKGYMETSNSWLNEQMVGMGTATTRVSQLDLQGNWEAPDPDTGEWSHPAMGQRYVPRNVGFALVESETADVFAMRLQHPDPSRRIVVGLRMQPNPDIPKDWNIITFPINPRYVKQGTLDGKVGFDPDADYPNALNYSNDSSYFKPEEAYRMQQDIEAEHQELQLQYHDYDSSPAGASGLAMGAGIGGGVGLVMGGPIAAVAGALVGAGIGAAAAGVSASDAMEEKLPNLASRNMVNTYVWTADGGMFSEIQQTMDVEIKTRGGSFSISGMAGLYADINTAISKVAVTFELEAMMGGHLNVVNQKNQESSNTFSVDVRLDVERDIFNYDELGTPTKIPGKVDAYRFMTFYLRPDKEHFEDFKNKVVDLEWLSSNDPNAIALNSAISSESGTPWRLMHRVTYVSRVLPEVDDPDTANTTNEALRSNGIESNYELIQMLEPYVAHKTQSYESFTLAVRDALHKYYPELLATDTAEDDIVEYMVTYFQVFQGA